MPVINKPSSTPADLLLEVRRAPIRIVLAARGVKRERDRWTCVFHEDHRPSATVWNNRLHCWSCGRWASTIDIVMHLDHVDLGTAVRRIAELNCIPLQDSFPSERKTGVDARQRSAEAADLRAAQHWRIVAIALAEQTLEELSPCSLDRMAPTSLLRTLRSDADILQEFRARRLADRGLTAAMVQAGSRQEERVQVLLARFLIAEAHGATT
jgi:DNA primase